MIPGFRPRKKKQKEGPIQQAVVSCFKDTFGKKGLAIKRIAGKYGTGGYPDYEFVVPHDAFEIEFKAPGEGCTDLQLQRHNELRALGRRVYVVDSVMLGKEIINQEHSRMKGRVRIKESA